MTDLKPGRELDEIIATRVMRWEKRRTWPPTPERPEGTGERVWASPGSKGYDFHWYVDDYDGDLNCGEPAQVGFKPSTSIEAAWEVVDKLGGNMFQLHYDTRYGTEGVKGWSVILDGSVMCQFVDTAPHAICLAALKAVEGR